MNPYERNKNITPHNSMIDGIAAIPTTFSFPNAPIKYVEKEQNIDRPISKINPYVLTKKEETLIAKTQKDARLYRHPGIKPITSYNTTPYDASPSKTAREVQEKYDAFQRRRSEIRTYEDKMPSDMLAYEEYNAFMKNLMQNLAPDLRNNPQEMAHVIKEFPVAFLEVNPSILTPELVQALVQDNPNIYVTLLNNPMHWENAPALVNNPDIIATYVSASIHQCTCLNEQDVSETNRALHSTDAEIIVTLPLHPDTPLEKVNPEMLYRQLSEESVMGHNVYSAYSENEIVVGPAITGKVLMREMFPDMAVTFKNIDKEVYKAHQKTLLPVSREHEEHLRSFAKSRQLPQPKHSFSPDTIKMQKQQKLQALNRPNPYSLTENERKLILSAQRQRNLLPTIKPPKTTIDATTPAHLSTQELLQQIQNDPKQIFTVDLAHLTPSFVAQAVQTNPTLYETMIQAAKKIEYLHLSSSQDSASPQNLLDAVEKRSLETAKALKDLTQDSTVIAAYLEGALKKASVFESRSILDEEKLQCGSFITNVATLEISPDCPLDKITPELYQKISATVFNGPRAYTIPSKSSSAHMDRDGVVGPAVTLRELIRDKNPDRIAEFNALDQEAYLVLSKTLQPISEKHQQDLEDYAKQHSLPSLSKGYQEQTNTQTLGEEGPTIGDDGPVR